MIPRRTFRFLSLVNKMGGRWSVFWLLLLLLLGGMTGVCWIFRCWGWGGVEREYGVWQG